MTVSATTRKAGPYLGNGSTTVFPFAFKVFAASDVVVTRTDLTGLETVLALTTHYTVSLNGDQDSSPGGTVNMLSAPVSGYLITMTSGVALSQSVTLTQGGNFYPSVISAALDKVTILAQQLAEQISRAVKIGVSSSSTPDAFISSLTSSASSASYSASAAQSAWDSFRSQYYGALSSDPALDPLGNAPGAGDFYLNTTSALLRVFSGSVWQNAQPTPAALSVFDQTFNGTGAQTAFTLSSAPYALAAVNVFVAGVRKYPTIDYSVSGTTLTFVAAPASGTNNVYVNWLAPSTSANPGNNTVGTSQLQDGAVTLAKNATMPASTIRGNNTGGSATPVDLTATQTTAMLNAMVGSNGTVAGTKGMVPAPAASDNVKFLRGDGTYAAPSASGVSSLNGNTGALTIAGVLGYTPGVGDITNGSNLGGGIGLFASKSGSTLQMKSIAAAGNAAITDSANLITITVSPPPSGACIHPYSMIDTPTKPVFACDIRPGSKIITPCGVETVFGVWESKLGDRKMVSINGKALITPGHLVPLADGRYAAFDLDEYEKSDRNKQHPIKNAEGVFVMASSDHDAVQLKEGMFIYMQGIDDPQEIETLFEYEFNQASLPVYSFVLERFTSFYCDGISVCTLDA